VFKKIRDTLLRYLAGKPEDRVFNLRNVSVASEVITGAYGIVINYILLSKIANALNGDGFFSTIEEDMALFLGVIGAIVYMFIVPSLVSKIIYLDNRKVFELLVHFGVNNNRITTLLFDAYMRHIFRAGWRVLLFEVVVTLVVYFLLIEIGIEVVLHVWPFVASIVVAIVIYIVISAYFVSSKVLAHVVRGVSAAEVHRQKFEVDS